jgi:hypothetical protein
MSVLINASTSTGLVQSADTSGEIELQSNGTTALKVNTNEGIQILNCLGVGNATPSTSGAGITFPATQSASSDANTLDDYEEGTWTPIATSGSGSITTYSSNGAYTKVGRIVTIFGSITTTTVGTAGGTLNFSGLPFATLNGEQYVGLSREAVNTGANNFAVISNSTGYLQSITGGAISWQNGSSFRFTITYQT